MLVRHAGGLVSFEVGDDTPLAQSITKRDLIESAKSKLFRFSQYDGFFEPDEEWKLLRVKRVVRTKGGLAFTKGEVVVGKFNDAEFLNGHEVLGAGWKTWSPVREGFVHLNESHVEVLEG